MSVRLRIKVLRLRQLSAAIGRFYDFVHRFQEQLEVELASAWAEVRRASGGGQSSPSATAPTILERWQSPA